MSHLQLIKKAEKSFIQLGYDLISLDKVKVAGYRPDLIFENKEEFLFIEIVITNDHDINEVVKEYKGKPVRFIKYYALDFKYKNRPSIVRTPLFRKITQSSRFNLSKQFLDEIDWQVKDQLRIEIMLIEGTNKIVITNESQKYRRPLKERLKSRGG